VNCVLELLGKGLDLDLVDLLGARLQRGWAEPDRGHDHSGSTEPRSTGEHLRIGLRCLREEELSTAIDHLTCACMDEPHDPAARVALATAHYQSGRTCEALANFERALQTGASEAEVLFAAGVCCERLGRRQEAREFYKRCLASESRFTPARERLAAVCLAAGDLHGAIDQYEIRCDAEPDSSWVRSTLGHLYYLGGMCAEAIEQYETVIAMGPENWAMSDEGLETLVAEGRISEAIDRIHKLLEEQGPFADLYVRLGDLYGQTGDEQRAISCYDAALDIREDYLEAMVKVGTTYLSADRFELAAEAFHRAAEINDRLLMNYVGLGVQKQDAENIFELASAIEPNSLLLLSETVKLQLRASESHDAPAVRYSKPIQAADLGLVEQDLMWRQLARHGAWVRYRPNEAQLRYRYAVLLRQVGKSRQACEQFTAAVRVNPYYTRAITHLGLVLRHLGRNQQAVETLNDAMKLDQEGIELHYRLGLLYADGRALQEAMSELKDAFGEPIEAEQVRQGVALSLQNMGLMDPAAATWRSLCMMDAA